MASKKPVVKDVETGKEGAYIDTHIETAEHIDTPADVTVGKHVIETVLSGKKPLVRPKFVGKPKYQNFSIDPIKVPNVTIKYTEYDLYEMEGYVANLIDEFVERLVSRVDGANGANLYLFGLTCLQEYEAHHTTSFLHDLFDYTLIRTRLYNANAKVVNIAEQRLDNMIGALLFNKRVSVTDVLKAYGVKIGQLDSVEVFEDLMASITGMLTSKVEMLATSSWQELVRVRAKDSRICVADYGDFRINFFNEHWNPDA